MNSSCASCDAYATAYHGPYAYCRRCLAEERLQNPDAHRCEQCGQEQPRNVSWHRVRPCRACQRKAAVLVRGAS